MKNLLKKYLLDVGVSQTEYKQISKEIQKSNRQNLIIFSGIAAVFLLVMFFLSYINSDVGENRWIYLGTMVLMLVILLMVKFYSDGHPKVLLTGMYLFIGILFLFGIILGTVTRPDEQTVTFIALILTVPLLFIDRPLRMICNIYVYVAVFVITAVYMKDDYVLAADIIDACVFGTISVIISTYMMSMKCQRYLYEHKVAVLSETDLLTGLRNRNSYEKRLSIYFSQSEKMLSCIFVDVNGLHEWNNRYGHEAGDKMLQFIAGKMQEQFGSENTYRIGGDEFVSFLYDCSQKEIEKKLDAVVQAVEEKNYHISIGYDMGFCTEKEGPDLIKNAEKRMYEAKSLYYQKQGIQRGTRGYMEQFISVEEIPTS